MEADAFSQMIENLMRARTPLEINIMMTDIETYLRDNSVDHNYYFFFHCFPTLLDRIFGFDNFIRPLKGQNVEKHPSWFDCALIDPDLSTKLFAFLCPWGILISTILIIDRSYRLEYDFPIRALPQWFCYAINRVPLPRPDVIYSVCPLFRGRVTIEKHDPRLRMSSFQFRVNLFEYFFFSFAYYAFCRSNCVNWAAGEVETSSKSSFQILEQQSDCDCNLYLRLLNEYLQAFARITYSNNSGPFISDSVAMRSEFVVNVFVHYWLLNTDYSPFSADWNGYVIREIFPVMPHLICRPPAIGLGQMVNLFVKYINLSLFLVNKHTNCGGAASLRYIMNPSVRDFMLNPEFDLWTTFIQRPLYRFILRTLLFSRIDMSVSMKNVCEVVSVWTDYIEIWKLSEEDIFGFDVSHATEERTPRASVRVSRMSYSPVWKEYVLSNYLFYTTLVMHFIVFAHKILDSHAEVIVPLVSKVIDIITSSKELMDLIKSVDATIHSYSAWTSNIYYKLRDWETNLSEAVADGSYLDVRQKKEFRLFRNGANGGKQLLKNFILRAMHHKLPENPRCIDSLKSQFHSLFGEHISSPSFQFSRTIQWLQFRAELFKQISSSTIKCKGD